MLLSCCGHWLANNGVIKHYFCTDSNAAVLHALLDLGEDEQRDHVDDDTAGIQDGEIKVF